MEQSLSTDVLAKIFDVDPSNLTHLWKRGVISRVEPGKYPPIAITQYIRYLRERSKGKRAPMAGGSVDGSGDVVDEKLRLTRAQADAAELKVALLKGDLHKADDVALCVGNMIAMFKQRALAIPTKLAPLMAVTKQDPTTYEALIKTEIEAMLNILKDYNPEDYGITSRQDNDRTIQEASGDSDATPGSDGFGMGGD